MNIFETVFVVPEKFDLSSGNYLFAVIGVIISLLALAKLIFRLYNKNSPPMSTKEKEQFVYGGCGLVVTGVMLAVITCASRENDWWATKKYATKDYHVVEGYVQLVKTGNSDPNVKTYDQLKIGNVYFTVNSYDRTQCYNVTMNMGGVLRNGAYVKVFYADTPNTAGVNNILRIDIDKSKTSKL